MSKEALKQQIEIWKSLFLGKPQFCGKVSNAQIKKTNLQMEKLRRNTCSQRHRLLKLLLLLQAERSGMKHSSLPGAFSPQRTNLIIYI